MNQAEEEESLYRGLEEEAIDVDSLLVEPRSDQVSVSGVWCFEGDNLGKCMKIDDVPDKFGGPDSSIHVESVDTTKLNVLDVAPHEVGMETLLTAGVSACDDYLLDIGFVEHVASMDYGSNEGLHMGSSNSESQVPGFNESDKGIFGISHLLSECQSNFLGKTTRDLQSSFSCNYVFGPSIAEDKSSKFTTSFESKSLDVFEDVSNSLICNENSKDNPAPRFVPNGMEAIPLWRDDGGAITQKRLRKPTKRYIDESSILDLMKCKKRKELSSASKVKILGVRRSKLTHQMKPKAKMASSEISFGKAIQVPFVSQGPTENQENHTSTVVEKCVESYSNGSEDDSGTTIRSMVGGNQRKLHRLWTVSEVKKLIDGVAHFGVGKWTHIKKLLFASSVHRTPVDLKDKWRNLLKASCALQGSKIEEEQKRSQPWRPLPKSILFRVRELATVYPYPREPNSKSKLVLVNKR